MRESLRFALRTSVAALLRGSKASPLRHPQSQPAKGLPSAWKPFLLHSSLPLVQVLSLFFCLCYFFFLLPYPSTGGASCLFGGRTFSASIQWVFCRSSSTCRCISTVSVGRKVISASYSSAIFSLLQGSFLCFAFLVGFCCPVCCDRGPRVRWRDLYVWEWEHALIDTLCWV